MDRKKLEIAYSIGVLIAIPLIVVVNTVILTQSTNKAFDIELRRKADLANSIISQSSIQLIQDKDYDKLQENLDALESSQPSLMHSAVIIKSNEDLKIVAHSSSAPVELTPNAEMEANLVYNRKGSVATFIDTYDRKSNPAQAWNVMTPVIDEKKDVIAVVSTSLLTVDAQEVINNAYQKSFIVLIISIILIVGLLFRHFRLVGYIRLLAKQRELNQTMNDFLSVATHELKAPTTIIKGYLSNVVEGDFGPVKPKIKEQIDVALSQTDRLNSLVQDLLNVSRVDQGRIEYKFTSVDTTKILNTIIENYRPIAEEKGLKLIFSPVDNLPFVNADEGRVQEVFTNLIDNAIKYTKNGSVNVQQIQKKDTIIINIRDTGFGISLEAKQRLFQRFYRVKTSETETISGTGLGLWIIKQYIEAMNGSIDVETMEGVGSNFIVKLQIK
ncbi:MAG: HAMP domain-containing sensor histidine kinase [Candidatus Saccharibacteria bacterium]